MRSKAAAYLMQQQQQLVEAASQRVEWTRQRQRPSTGSYKASRDLQERLDSAGTHVRSILHAASMRAVWRNTSNNSNSSQACAAQQQQRKAQQSWATRTWGCKGL